MDLEKLLTFIIPDPEDCHRAAQELRLENPNATPEQAAEAAVKQSRKWAVSIGATTGAFASPFSMLPAAVADAAAMLRLEGKLAGTIAALLDPDSLRDPAAFRRKFNQAVSSSAGYELFADRVFGFAATFFTDFFDLSALAVFLATTLRGLAGALGPDQRRKGLARRGGRVHGRGGGQAGLTPSQDAVDQAQRHTPHIGLKADSHAKLHERVEHRQDCNEVTNTGLYPRPY